MQKYYPLQPIADIVQLCALKGIKEAVLSPGSRCAPLTLGFVRHPDIHTRTISDERSAAFIAMGIAQQQDNPVAIVCTSGTAALNYAPAVTEAYYQHIPMLVLTADRPDEWIDQLDGQTIRQRDIFSNHIKKSYHLPVDYSHPEAQWYIQRSISEAINLSKEYPQGPVHVNIPIREPFYPEIDEQYFFNPDLRNIEEHTFAPVMTKEHFAPYKTQLKSFSKVLIVAGQTKGDQELGTILEQFPYPVCADVISNYSYLKNAIHHQDVFLGKVDEALQPDLLVTFGNSVISKNLKLYLRKYKPKAHWHIQEAGHVADTFQSLSSIIRCTPKSFFEQWATLNHSTEEYLKDWKKWDEQVTTNMASFLKGQPFSELETVHDLLQALPENTQLHLANSMSVRYANFINLQNRKDITVFANRGTSGIDGSNSTMIGHSLATDYPNVLLTGDLAFFYDRNAFWNSYRKGNQKVLLLNNHGGVIFRMIPGPARQPELEDYFETPQQSTAQQLCEEFGIAYLHANSRDGLEELLPAFIASDQACILEVETDKAISKEVFQAFKKL
ncbi:2-succinyl-5-enolpyruvyl-6-hydroxy-3-cyclohexene-1-carboxylic-acid synthase [Algivirga pacifica]|uniref:2-succinyl-5-enolpyruvyl-6-hydroxy-3-cyclohexene-1-carboxylate synthase n=1 Tax=Algivirga pacifica TaxID=1162670 RepID=A0ABP9DP19_9BACT